jgi:hypothetical protein
MDPVQIIQNINHKYMSLSKEKGQTRTCWAMHFFIGAVAVPCTILG